MNTPLACSGCKPQSSRLGKSRLSRGEESKHEHATPSATPIIASNGREVLLIFFFTKLRTSSAAVWDAAPPLQQEDMNVSSTTPPPSPQTPHTLKCSFWRWKSENQRGRQDSPFWWADGFIYLLSLSLFFFFVTVGCSSLICRHTAAKDKEKTLWKVRQVQLNLHVTIEVNIESRLRGVLERRCRGLLASSQRSLPTREWNLICETAHLSSRLLRKCEDWPDSTQKS